MAREGAELQIEVIGLVAMIQTRRLDERSDLEARDQALLAHRINELLLANLLSIECRLCRTLRNPEHDRRLGQGDVHELGGRSLNVMVEGYGGSREVVDDEIVIEVIHHSEAETRMDVDNLARDCLQVPVRTADDRVDGVGHFGGDLL